jgi:hypothetical protein
VPNDVALKAMHDGSAADGMHRFAQQPKKAKVACTASVLGIAGWVATILVNLCGGSCAFAETPPTAAICAACITGIVSTGGGALKAVLACFKL